MALNSQIGGRIAEQFIIRAMRTICEYESCFYHLLHDLSKLLKPFCLFLYKMRILERTWKVLVYSKCDMIMNYYCC